MAERVKAAEKQTVEAVEKPISAWRRMINRTGEIVSKPWRRYRAFIFLLYVIIAAGVFLILAVLARAQQALGGGLVGVVGAGGGRCARPRRATGSRGRPARPGAAV